MLTVCFFIVAALVIDGQEAAQCQSGWLGLGNMCYRFGRSEMTWPDAQTVCQNYDATLAEPRDASINDWLKLEMQARNLSKSWLGAADLFQEGSFEWVSDGAALGPFTDWRHDQPSDSNWGEDCMEIWDSNGLIKWNDDDCYFKSPFICQKLANVDVIVG